MKPVLLVDFGSTYTKVTAVDTDARELLGTAQSYTTVRTDITEGLNSALSLLKNQTGDIKFEETYACSSAAGGLRMIASGLVPELTSEAAKTACLGAGAKLVGVYSYEMTDGDIEEIKSLKPDIILLAGGTDGGNRSCVIHNAGMLTSLPKELPIVFAGNRAAAGECARILEGHALHVCGNVMPKFGVLSTDEVQKKIREIFLGRIIQAKGLSSVSSLLDDIIMPTPAAVLNAMTLLADGYGGKPGIGSLVGIDVGGATTDVYSVADGMPKQSSTVYKGIPEPYAKRTVEGDIGMRYSVKGISDAAGTGKIAALAGMTEERASELIGMLAENTGCLPGDNRELQALDYALASSAVHTAVTRHAGHMEQAYTMLGPCLVQTGKDLRGVRQIVVTGGSLIHTERTEEIARHALRSGSEPESLCPEQAEIRIDRKYILAAMGLLSVHYPDAALEIMKKELSSEDGNPDR